MNRQQLQQQGETAKQIGMSLAADAKFDKVQNGKIAFLRAILQSPDGCGTIDDATADLATEFDDGGKWRGTVVRSLAYSGIIERDGIAISDRPSRHRGYIGRWRLKNRADAKRMLSRLVSVMTATSSAAEMVNETPTAPVAKGRAAGASVQSHLPGFNMEGIESGQAV